MKRPQHMNAPEGKWFRELDDGTLVFNRGRFNGKTLIWIAEMEPSYLFWMQRNHVVTAPNELALLRRLCASDICSPQPAPWPTNSRRMAHGYAFGQQDHPDPDPGNEAADYMWDEPDVG